MAITSGSASGATATEPWTRSVIVLACPPIPGRIEHPNPGWLSDSAGYYLVKCRWSAVVLSSAQSADAESVPLVRHALRVYLERFDLSDDRIAEVTLAVTEACSNVVVHAYRDDPGELEVIVEDDPVEGVIVRVRDHGDGMHPRADSPGLGVGLPVIYAIADSVQVSSNGDGNGTELRMHFR